MRKPDLLQVVNAQIGELDQLASDLSIGPRSARQHEDDDERVRAVATALLDAVRAKRR